MPTKLIHDLHRCSPWGSLWTTRNRASADYLLVPLSFGIVRSGHISIRHRAYVHPTSQASQILERLLQRLSPCIKEKWKVPGQFRLRIYSSNMPPSMGHPIVNFFSLLKHPKTTLFRVNCSQSYAQKSNLGQLRSVLRNLISLWIFQWMKKTRITNKFRCQTCLTPLFSSQNVWGCLVPVDSQTITDKGVPIIWGVIRVVSKFGSLSTAKWALWTRFRFGRVEDLSRAFVINAERYQSARAQTGWNESTTFN